MNRLPARLGFLNSVGDATPTSVQVKDADASLRATAIPRAHMGEDDPRNPDDEVDINLDTNKAKLLLMASMLKLGRLPRAKGPRNPQPEEREAVLVTLAAYREIFANH
ncbi:hypothetical protein NKDENANG_03636 [Candidatus Entotheonellaceae bacterium PAL068K]